MKGDIKDLVRSNRKDFDNQEPEMAIWDRIERELDKDDDEKIRKIRSVRLKRFLSVAAVLALVFSASLIIYRSANTTGFNYSDIDPALAQQQADYSKLIEEKRDQLASFGRREPDLYREFSGELQRMESNYRELKQDLPDSPNQELMLEAMIQNLRMQIEVLNQQLDVLNYLEQKEKNTPYEHL